MSPLTKVNLFAIGKIQSIGTLIASWNATLWTSPITPRSSWPMGENRETRDVLRTFMEHLW